MLAADAGRPAPLRVASLAAAAALLGAALLPQSRSVLLLGVPAAVGEDRRHLLAVQRNLDVTETHPTRTDRRRYQVHPWRSDEACNKRIGRPIVKFCGRSELLQLPALEHCHAVTHRHRFHLIVRDVDGGGSETTLQRRDLRAGLDA